MTHFGAGKPFEKPNRLAYVAVFVKTRPCFRVSPAIHLNFALALTCPRSLDWGRLACALHVTLSHPPASPWKDPSWPPRVPPHLFSPAASPSPKLQNPSRSQSSWLSRPIVSHG